VRCDGVTRTYGTGQAATVALQATDCEVNAGQRIGLVGPSGSGKSTLLHLMAGLDDPSTGAVSWPAIGTRAELRPARMAVIFQGPSLLPPLSVLENTALPLVIGGMTDTDAQRVARGALGTLGLEELADKLPEEISGGQAQRVAVARALAGRPSMILADEPTGQLDSVNASAVVDVLIAASALAGAALVISTHDLQLAAGLPERWEIHNGQLTNNAREATWSH
jgi:putative ABC transport system ATP-binding protein/lipoprotein-releasing system ATP-binding protein